jgi:PI-3-kinase-related kinase SMG-1
MTRSIECLQACERTSCSAEGQLERAMGWACAGPNTSGAGGSTAKGSGIPPEFHDHLLKRRKLLGGVQEQASDIVKSCTAVLEFEASRDGLYFVSEDKSSGQSTDKGRAWQQTFLNLLTRLDAAYHSFTCKLITSLLYFFFEILLYFCYIYICARILCSAHGTSNILWVIFVEGSETLFLACKK